MESMVIKIRLLNIPFMTVLEINMVLLNVANKSHRAVGRILALYYFLHQNYTCNRCKGFSNATGNAGALLIIFTLER